MTERLDNLIVDGVLIRRQPPVRVRYTWPDGRRGTLDAPPDSWRIINRTLLSHRDLLQHRKEIVQIHFCRPPSSGKAHLPCAYSCKTCAGESRTCNNCGHRFCATHYAGHARRLSAPPTVWARVLASYAQQLKEAARTSGRSRIRITPVQLVEFA